ncbi:hypothetical protein NP233_g12436 [Leucocoprinus birnbaumii]|uniref:Uncharacterized protein n=1 Tax=Leucocoprinus birnbaumii TaxID=56174 RepID=A0AAD5VFP3_9AGAR|nr:hypothetical protein NP233_g12436 [Leucocoprinus birnbaumii]
MDRVVLPSNAKDLHGRIDNIPVGDVPWHCFSYEVWFRDICDVLEGRLANPSFDGHIDYAPKHVRNKDDKRVFTDLMSREWAWEQADILTADPAMHGAMFAPVVLGSDKTTVLVAMGPSEYYPLYASLGNLEGHIRRAHGSSVAVVGFLAIPKYDKEHEGSDTFRTFHRQVMHDSLKFILSHLKDYMSKPKVTRCADGHYRRVVYGVGPYVADYPEQCLLTCVVNSWCPKDGDDAEIVEDGLVPSTADVRFSLRAVPNYPPSLHELSRRFELSNTLLPTVRRFLYDQLNPDAEIMGMAAELDLYPMIDPFIHASVYHSAACLIQAPGSKRSLRPRRNMRREYIRASPNWRNTGPRHDCVLVDGDPQNNGFLGFNVGQVHFFRFEWNEKSYDFAFLQWFGKAQATACPNTVLWMVQPQVNLRKERVCSLVHIDKIYSAVHLIGSTGTFPASR